MKTCRLVRNVMHTHYLTCTQDSINRLVAIIITHKDLEALRSEFLKAVSRLEYLKRQNLINAASESPSNDRIRYVESLMTRARYQMYLVIMNATFLGDDCSENLVSLVSYRMNATAKASISQVPARAAPYQDCYPVYSEKNYAQAMTKVVRD
ncbi:unnamed protein product [Sphagnum troendelagicum]